MGRHDIYWDTPGVRQDDRHAMVVVMPSCFGAQSLSLTYINRSDRFLWYGGANINHGTRGPFMDRTPPPVHFLSSLRNRFQLALFGLTLAIGLQFFLFVRQAANGGSVTIPRPAGVEGFLPIGALLGWKQFLTTGIWDPIHPAAMVILLYAGMVSLLFRRSFCSWFCPVGTLSEWLWKAGHRLLGRNLQLPGVLDWPLRSLKYLLLAFFVGVTIQMAPAEIASFLNSPYYKLADVKMLHFFTRIGDTTLITIIVLTLLSVLIRNFWCRYLCPYGALMAICALFSPTTIRRRSDTCTNCLRCSRVCPSHLTVHRQLTVVSPACSSCMDCVNACPSAGTLTLTTPGLGSSGWNTAGMALAVGLAFVVMVVAAKISGHWQSGIGDVEFRMLLRMIDDPMMTHPTF
jgi:polyferredoxin